MIDKFVGEYRFLSNFYPAEITIDGITYPTVEHYYQAAKTEDISLKKEIAKCSTPGKARRKGRELLLRKDWGYVKNGIMINGVVLKFTTHENLRKRLLKTEPHELVEGNTWGDTQWGVCNNKGKNMLGKILMVVRKIISE